MPSNKSKSNILGHALRHARRRAYISMADAAQLLRVSETELARYECGTADIDQVPLEMLLFMGYTMLNARRVQYQYWHMRRMMVRENIDFDM